MLVVVNARQGRSQLRPGCGPNVREMSESGNRAAARQLTELGHRSNTGDLTPLTSDHHSELCVPAKCAIYLLYVISIYFFHIVYLLHCFETLTSINRFRSEQHPPHKKLLT